MKPKRYIRKRILVTFTKDYILSLPKIINSNGCWIPAKIRSNSNGYCRVGGYQKYYLHRLMLSIYHNLDYFDQSWDARHGKNCSRACFNPEHLKPGTQSDNSKDRVEHGTHNESRKLVCPICGGPYRTIIIQSELNKGRTFRVCDVCVARRGREREARNRKATEQRNKWLAEKLERKLREAEERNESK